ncbi:MAG: citramalate synthase, partial [Candidatus Omnitrophica bacterium]|nr:citramalate synthase [Candidatus Omnitrophota bacterium]
MKIELYDTTLRDGAQTEGVSYSVNDKINIAKKLDELGIQYIEGGWPGANPKDSDFFRKMKRIKLKNSQLVGFCSTRHPRKKIYLDQNIRGVLNAQTEIVTIFGKSWDLHVREVLKVSLEDNLDLIRETIGYFKSKNKKVFYDAEHFFDGYKANPEYALKTILVAQQAGADTIVLCDTNGGSLPEEVYEIIQNVKNKINIPLGIHSHNDLGLAVANSLVAIKAGCSHIQGTFNGLGERCGNADLATLIGILKLKLKIDCISDVNLKRLTHISHYIWEVSNLKPQDNQPFVGRSAFAHKGGVHIDAMLKNPKTYEHIEPTSVGNHRRFLVSELSGKSSIVAIAKDIELSLDKKSSKAKKIFKLLQDLEHRGYQFEAAEGSFKLLLNKELKRFKKFFELEGFRVIVEKRPDERVFAEATIRLKVKGKEQYTASEGSGPVNALDNALRKALIQFYPQLAKMHLSDFKVRVLDEKAGTAAKVRVLIQSQDEKESWGTVGVSENIIEASWQALIDSIEYKLLKDKI